MVGMAGFLDEVDVLRSSSYIYALSPIPVSRCFSYPVVILLCCCNLVFVQMCCVVYCVFARPFLGPRLDAMVVNEMIKSF